MKRLTADVVKFQVSIAAFQAVYVVADPKLEYQIADCF
jgi:hypothetical protein